MRAAGAAVVVLFLTCAQIAVTRAQALDDMVGMLDAYGAIAERYRKGDPDAVAELVRLGPERLKLINDFMARAVREPGLLTPYSNWTWAPRLLRAAGMLHTDLALEAYRDGTTLVFDQHVVSADRLFLLAALVDTTSDFRERWHLAIGLHLSATVSIDQARNFLARSCALFPVYARLRLACGMSSATYASVLRLAPEDALRWYIDSSQRTSRERDEQRRTLIGLSELQDAALAHFDASRSADPSMVESALRAAQLLLDRGRDADAERLLAPLVPLDRPPAIPYLARLMLGRIREKERQFEAAAALYRDATAVLPEGSRARLALAHLLHTTGDRAASRDIVQRLVTPSLSPPEDPWTMYPIEFVGTQHDTLGDLRREVRK
jgi:tetratricopeptide (TPR) repeat protein